MATLTIKALPDPLYERLRESAAMNHRSINSEVIARLERALGSARLDAGEQLAVVRAVRERMGAPITAAWLEAARTEGRP